MKSKAASPRRHRGVPSKAHDGLALQPRDLAALHFVGRVAFATTAQVALAVADFGTETQLRRRARQWLDHDLVRIVVGQMKHPNILALTSAGLAAVEDQIPESGARLAGTIPVNCDHHLLGVWLRVYALALRDAGAIDLFGWHGGRSAFAADVGLRDYKLICDAVLDVALRSGRDTVVAVEVDCATESSAVLRAKFERLAGWLQTDCDRELWIVAAGGPQAPERLATIAAAAGIERIRLFAEEFTRQRPVRPLPEYGALEHLRHPAQERTRTVSANTARTS